MTPRTVSRVLVGGSERELVKIGLADQNRTGLSEPRDHEGVAAGHMARADAGRGRCWNSGDIDQILQRDRNPVQRSTVHAGGHLAIGNRSLLPGAVGSDADKGVQTMTARGDDRETLLGELARRRASRPDVAAGRRD